MSRDLTEMSGYPATKIDLQPDWLVVCRVCGSSNPAEHMLVFAVNRDSAEFVCPSCHDAWGS